MGSPLEDYPSLVALMGQKVDATGRWWRWRCRWWWYIYLASQRWCLLLTDSRQTEAGRTGRDDLNIDKEERRGKDHQGKGLLEGGHGDTADWARIKDACRGHRGLGGRCVGWGEGV